MSIYSQIGVTTYSIYSLGINTSKSKMISGELKSFFNQGDNTLFEFSGMYNFKVRDSYQFSTGVGIGVAPFSGSYEFRSLSLPIQFEIFPLKDFKQLSFVIELAPEWVIPDGALNIRHLWGIRYTFKKD